MIESLADIEALTLACRSEQSREYINEAVVCYRSGAFRATIVSVWIAIVFDLIDKIRELSLTGDGNAVELERQYQTYLRQIEDGNANGVRSALEFERDILIKCKEKLQLFDAQQMIDLGRLREDRHRCAHPSFQRVGQPYRPTAEQARVHLRNAVVHVLAQPPVQGRSAVAELAALVGSNYFPTDTDKAVAQLRSSALRRPSDALIRGFVDKLVFGFVAPADPLRYKRQTLAALNAMLEMHPVVAEQRLRAQLPKIVRDVADDQFLGVAVLVAGVDGAWASLEPPAREKVLQFVRTADVGEIVKGANVLRRIEALLPELNTRLDQLDRRQLADGIANNRLGGLAKRRAIALLGEARDWGDANSSFNTLIFPIFEHLDANDMETVLALPRQTGADLRGSHGLAEFIDRASHSNLFEPDAFTALLTRHGLGPRVNEEHG